MDSQHHYTYETTTALSQAPSSPHTSKHNNKKKKRKKNFLYKYRRVFYLFAGMMLLMLLGKASFFKVDHLSDSKVPQLLTLDEDSLNKVPLDSVISCLSASTLEDPQVQSLIESSNDYPSAKIILSQLADYPESLLQLAANKPETIDFVAHYLEYDPDALETSISIDKDYTPGHIPLFLQWDKRWGYEKYGDDFIAINGCGPTCLSMVAVALTGNTQLNPKAISDFSYNAGYLISEQGTSWSLMTDGAAKFGLLGQMIPADIATIRSLLEAGTPIIASMRPGHFTTEGHFIVLTHTDADGNIYVNDPDSISRSQKSWDLSLILNECKGLWSYQKS